MASQRQLKSVLHNLVGTFTSRYAEFDGYWLPGSFVEDVKPFEIDLLSKDIDASATGPAKWATHLARLMFADQLAKAGLTGSSIHDASLTLVTGPAVVDGGVGWPPRIRRCREFNVSARAVSDLRR